MSSVLMHAKRRGSHSVDDQESQLCSTIVDHGGGTNEPFRVDEKQMTIGQEEDTFKTSEDGVNSSTYVQNENNCVNPVTTNDYPNLATVETRCRGMTESISAVDDVPEIAKLPDFVDEISEIDLSSGSDDGDTIHSDNQSSSPPSPPPSPTFPATEPHSLGHSKDCDSFSLGAVSLPDFISTNVGIIEVDSGLSLPDLASPEPQLKVTKSEVRRAASLLRHTDSHSKPRQRRSSCSNTGESPVTDSQLSTQDLNSSSRSASPATGALRQISRRLCPSVTSLDSVTSFNVEPARSHRPRLSHHKQRKVEKIFSTLNEDPSNVSAVRQLAISKCGLVSNDVRIQAWPKLLNVDPTKKLRRRSWDELTQHRDYNQVVLDVRRSLRRFPPGLTEEEQELLQEKLNTLILRVLCEHEDLHYYQGYHDICVTFLLAVGEDMAFALMDRLSNHHLRDFMDSTMERTTHILNYLLPLVGRVRPELRDHVEAAGVGTIFALSWLITWFGHVLDELKHIVRLYDFFLACHPLMPLYLAAAIVVHRERDILDTECDFAMLHCTLSKCPDDLPWETLISNAGDYFIQFPPSDLAVEAEWQYQKGLLLKESRLAARKGAKSQGRGQIMTRNKRGAWIPLDQPKRVASRLVVWTFYASVGAAAYAVYTAGGLSWLWPGN